MTSPLIINAIFSTFAHTITPRHAFQRHKTKIYIFVIVPVFYDNSRG